MIKIESGLGCGGYLMVLIISAIIGGFCWTYSLNTWLEFFSKEPNIVFWQGMVIGFVPYFGQVSIPFAIGTWVLMLFLV